MFVFREVHMDWNAARDSFVEGINFTQWIKSHTEIWQEI